MHLTGACHSSHLTKAVIVRVLVGGSNSSKDNNINSHDFSTMVVEKSENFELLVTWRITETKPAYNILSQ